MIFYEMEAAVSCDGETDMKKLIMIFYEGFIE